MPKYHEFDRWDDATNAPSSNFIYDFETLRFFVRENWCEVLHHASDGTVLSGSIYLGFGFAALRNADDFWASETYTLAIIMITTALVGGLSRRGTARATWIGFAVFGWIYLLIDQLPHWPIGGLGAGPIPKPVLLIEYGIARLRPYINPLSATLTGSEWVQYEQVSFSLGIILFALLGAVLGRLVAVKDDPPISS